VAQRGASGLRHDHSSRKPACRPHTLTAHSHNAQRTGRPSSNPSLVTSSTGPALRPRQQTCGKGNIEVESKGHSSRRGSTDFTTGNTPQSDLAIDRAYPWDGCVHARIARSGQGSRSTDHFFSPSFADCARSKAFLGTDTCTFEGISTHLSDSAFSHHRTVADFAYEVRLPFFGEKSMILSAALDPLPVASEVEIWFPAAIHRSLSGRIVGPNTTTRVEKIFSAGGAPYSGPEPPFAL
jgi:hypothetical protein